MKHCKVSDMNHTERSFDDPYPVPPRNIFTSVIETESELFLPYVEIQDSAPFDTILHGRYSERELLPPTIDDISILMKLSLNIRAQSSNHYGTIQSRSIPASGGLHAYDIAFIGGPFHKKIALYNPNRHSIAYIRSVCPQDLEPFRNKLDTIFPNSDGVSIVFLADSSRYHSKYENWETLALRDSGALLGIMSLCAQRLGLGFCIAGMLGNEISNLYPFQISGRIGMGVAVVGKPLNNDLDSITQNQNVKPNWVSSELS